METVSNDLNELPFLKVLKFNKYSNSKFNNSKIGSLSVETMCQTSQFEPFSKCETFGQESTQSEVHESQGQVVQKAISINSFN